MPQPEADGIRLWMALPELRGEGNGGKLMNIYVIGPVTGIPKDNLPVFNSVRGEIMQAGHRVDIPHDCITSGVAW